jgi:hypothetical protein
VCRLHSLTADHRARDSTSSIQPRQAPDR